MIFPFVRSTLCKSSPFFRKKNKNFYENKSFLPYRFQLNDMFFQGNTSGGLPGQAIRPVDPIVFDRIRVGFHRNPTTFMKNRSDPTRFLPDSFRSEYSDPTESNPLSMTWDFLLDELLKIHRPIQKKRN